jgi:tetratricopeptide (TPR) repeat protein
MASMLEVMREYKHLTAKKRAEGSLPPSLEERLAELENVVKASSASSKPKPAPVPEARTRTPLPAAPPADAARSRPAPVAKPPPAAASRPAPRASADGPMRASSPPSQSARSTPSQDLPRVAQQAAARGESSLLSAPIDASMIDRIADRLPAAFPQRAAILLVCASFMLSAVYGLWVGLLGFSSDRVIGGIFPMLMVIGGIGWLLIYPGLMSWRESAARKGSAHINEPDFEAKVPVVEPVIGVLTMLGTVIWIWLGGYTTQGLGVAAGLLITFSFGIAVLALSSVLAYRPFAKRKMKERALRQYVEGGAYHLQKGNAKRARRLLDRAMDEALGGPKMNEVAKYLKQATLLEADELRKKGHLKQADDLVRNQSSRVGMELVVGWGDGAPSEEAPTAKPRGHSISSDIVVDTQSINDLIASAPSQPRVLTASEIIIENSRNAGAKPSADEAALRERARILERKGRCREALEILITGKVPVAAALAREAVKEYISKGVLRSADAIYEALGERQIAEFYQAVAIEWAKETNGSPPPDVALRIARILADLGQLEPAARIACRGALSKDGGQAREDVTRLALQLCKKLNMEPPVELLEAMGDPAAAAHAYEQEGRTEEALRCYRQVADQMLEAKEAPARLIPILSKIFLLDNNTVDKYLEPLAFHVIESNAAGPISLKILTVFRKRRRDDDRLSSRLFALLVDAQQQDEAYTELELLTRSATSNPEPQLKDYRLFVDRFPDHLKARAQYIRALLKVGRVDDAAAHVHNYINRAQKTNADPAETIGLIELLLDWGHTDNDLRKAMGLMRIRIGKVEEGLKDLEVYVREGGRDPDAIALAKSMLGEKLALDSGAPDHERLLRLGRFVLFCGDPESAVQHLEIARSSKEQKAEASLLLARANMGLGQPRKAVALIKEVIGSRSIKETLDAHYELARAFEACGLKPEADKIDRALAAANPEFKIEYEKKRPRFDRSDTAWAPESAFPVEKAGSADITEPKESLPEPLVDVPAKAAADDLVVPPVPPSRPQVSSRPSVSPSGSRPRPIAPSSPSASAPGGHSSSGSVRSLSGQGLSPDRSAAETQQNLGDTLLPRYQLLRKLGAGGMGEVHLAEDVDLGRNVAIKVLRRTLATDLFLAKFREEARIVAQLAHPNIVAIYDLGQRGNWSYIVMEYVDGFDLATLVNKSGGFERKRLINIVAMTASAMSYAHTRGVIHRDLKPANILVGPSDFAKVTDFGIAKVLQPDGAQETAFSAAGLQVGTVNYMAPEQISGKDVDARTDVYLLGTTLYVCLTGSFPFMGDAVAFQKLRDDPTSVRVHAPSITAELDACVMKCLTRKPENRFQTMDELADALRRVPEARGAKR